MKSYIPLLGIALALGLSACNESARLADQLPGVWTGTPENFSDNSAVSATIIESYAFSPDTSAKAQKYSGTLTITGAISSNIQVVGSESFIEPLNLTAAAVSTISGTWRVVDDDEISIALNPATLNIKVDRDGVAINSNLMNGNASPAIDSIRPEIVSTIENGMRQSLANRYAHVRMMDDVKIKKPIMKFEIGKTDYVLTLQQPYSPLQ